MLLFASVELSIVPLIIEVSASAAILSLGVLPFLSTFLNLKNPTCKSQQGICLKLCETKFHNQLMVSQCSLCEKIPYIGMHGLNIHL